MDSKKISADENFRKTQIALEYAYWVKETHPDTSVFWVHASNIDRFTQGCKDILQKCEVEGFDDSKADALLLLRDWLQQERSGRWLLIIDNADDAQLFSGHADNDDPGATKSSTRSLARYIPECSHGVILITTKNNQIGLDLTKGQRTIIIDRMDEIESCQLLRTKLQDQSVDSDQLEELSIRLDHLPLALAHAGAYIRRNVILVTRYLQLLDESDQNMIEILSEEHETDGRDADSPKAVAKTWMLSFEQIKKQDTLAANLLSFMSVLDQHGIPESFLSFYSEQARNGGPIGVLRLTKSLGLLKSFSLVVQERDGNFDIHRLVQLVTRNWVSRGNFLHHFYREALFTMAMFYPKGEYEDRITCATYLPHANKVLQWKFFELNDELKAYASISHKFASYAFLQGQWGDAANLLTLAVRTRETLLGEDHPKTLAIMSNLAIVYRKQGKWEKAERLGEKLLDMNKVKLGEDHRNTLAIMSNLAIAYGKQGKWEKAEQLGEKVLDMNKVKLGEDHPDTLTSMSNLALLYENQGQWGKAEWLGEKVLDMRKVKLGEDHPNTLTSMNNLAIIYSCQGRFNEAEKLLTEVLETRKIRLGEDHPDTLTSMHNLAALYYKQGQSNKAKKLQLETLETQKIRLGEDHPDTLNSMSNLAITYFDQGRHDEAEKIELKVLETQKIRLGEDHPDTMISMNNLAHILHALGNHSKAISLMEVCVVSRRRKLGSQHPYTCSSEGWLHKWKVELDGVIDG